MPRSITIDSRRPCQPIIEPSQTREELRREARLLEVFDRTAACAEVLTADSAFGRYVRRRLIPAQG